MPEIVQTKNRHGETRFGWHCGDCGAAAGAWPERKTADASAWKHDNDRVFTATGSALRCKAKRAAA